MINKKNNIRELDPFLERERAQYENPLPSREYILQLLEKQGVPVDMVSTGPDRDETIVLRHPFE